MEEKIEEIKKIIKEEKIKNIFLMFVDFSGRILTKMVGASELIRNTHVSWFDGISLNGTLLNDFEGNKESSEWLVLLPDPYSFRVLPFLKDEYQKSGIIFCDIKNHPLDTRGTLKKAVEEFLDLGMTPMFGTQSIYAILNTDQNQGFYQIFATNPNTIFHNNVVNNLLEAGIEIEYYMPYGKKHQRIDLVPDVASIAADKLFTAKWFIQNLAILEQKEISFENIDQPFVSSCPVHMSLWKGKHEKNLFFEEEDNYELSKTGKKFIQGILQHQKFIQNMVKATSSYPVMPYANRYSVHRDNSMVQVPLYFKEKQKRDRIGWSKRCIYNGLNADVNYYLLFSCLLYAGLYGVSSKEDQVKKLSLSESEEYFTKKLGKEIVKKGMKEFGK